MSAGVPVVAPADRPGGTDARQETAPVTVAGFSLGSRSLRGQSCLSCFLRWVFRDQSMKTTNAENDGKTNDRQFDILTNEHADIAFVQGLRRGLLIARAYTMPGSIPRERFDALIREATGNIEALSASVDEDTPPALSLKDWLSFPADTSRRFPLCTVLYVTFLLVMAFAVARAYGSL